MVYPYPCERLLLCCDQPCDANEHDPVEDRDHQTHRRRRKSQVIARAAHNGPEAIQELYYDLDSSNEPFPVSHPLRAHRKVAR
jgi:hypothetical protein